MGPDQHVYRRADFRAICASCADPARHECTHCGRVLCERHGSLSAAGYCVECDVELSRRVGFPRELAFAVATIVGMAGAVCALAMGPAILLMGMALAGSAIAIGALVGASLHWRFRRYDARIARVHNIDGLRIAVRSGMPARPRRRLGLPPWPMGRGKRRAVIRR